MSGERVVVTDFGIARVTDATTRITSTGIVMGTLLFMAPEQLEGSAVGPAADMWSLGATLYLAVEGKAPFDGPTQAAIIAGILARDPAEPVFSGPATDVITQLLRKSPDARPAAAETARSLRAPGVVPAPPIVHGWRSIPLRRLERHSRRRTGPLDHGLR